MWTLNGFVNLETSTLGQKKTFLSSPQMPSIDPFSIQKIITFLGDLKVVLPFTKTFL